MIFVSERLQEALSRSDFPTVRKAFIARARLESGRIADARQWMFDNGFDLLDVPEERLLTDDGREVLRAHGKAWALRPEIHAKRLAEAMEQARQRDSALVAQQEQLANTATQATTCTALIDGQLCGGTLVRASVCPRCALGKSGVAATLTCDVCGRVTAIMQGGRNG